MPNAIFRRDKTVVKVMLLLTLANPEAKMGPDRLAAPALVL